MKHSRTTLDLLALQSRHTATAAPAAPASAVSPEATASALLRALQGFARIPSRYLSDVLLHAHGLALAHGLAIPKRCASRAKPTANLSALRFAVVCAGIAYAGEPTAETLRALLRAIDADARATNAAHATTPARHLSATVPGFDPSPPRVHVVPVGALDWQTSNPMGTDPCDVLALRERHASAARAHVRKTAPQKSSKRASRIARALALLEMIPNDPARVLRLNNERY